ncbi:potassium voltage-gated channel subfamily KQT member 2 isoform X4 [Penaeus vannamei]|uniref:potassium voltage-gated channel subfamily KQT member 2 isoform X4 n=1 Tax=Penaeus vannamei TaxID=6689 RepID=UPI00387F62AA
MTSLTRSTAIRRASRGTPESSLEGEEASVATTYVRRATEDSDAAATEERSGDAVASSASNEGVPRESVNGKKPLSCSSSYPQTSSEVIESQLSLDSVMSSSSSPEVRQVKADSIVHLTGSGAGGARGTRVSLTRDGGATSLDSIRTSSSISLPSQLSLSMKKQLTRPEKQQQQVQDPLHHPLARSSGGLHDARRRGGGSGGGPTCSRLSYSRAVASEGEAGVTVTISDTSSVDSPLLSPHHQQRPLLDPSSSSSSAARAKEPKFIKVEIVDAKKMELDSGGRFERRTTILDSAHKEDEPRTSIPDGSQSGHDFRRLGRVGGSRLHQPRMSLLGKPLNYKTSRRDVRYRRSQARVYNFLERPRGVKAVIYHLTVFCTIFTCLTLSALSTVDEYEDSATQVLFYIESFVVVWFTIEYFLRLWSSGCRSRYQGIWGRMKYAKRPFCCIDMVTIVASVVVLANGTGGQVVSAVRGLRFFQILRMVRMDRRGGTWKLLGSVVYAHRQELLTTVYIGFLGLIFSSFLVYLVEKDINDNFKTFPDALWWGVITLCTVGYGDAVPMTYGGKMIASGCALLGISFFALPAGILGSGFALKVQQQQRQKHMIRRRQPAATLIQCLWRCYAADEHSMSVATWKIHQVPLPSPPSIKIEEKDKTPNSTSLFKHNASFVRLPTIRRHRNAHSPSIKNRHIDSNHALENLVNSNRLNASHSEDSVSKESSEALLTKKNSDDEDDEQPRVLQLTNQHKGAIRAIRKIRYFLARRKFKEALKPYDVKDVIEQYSSGHADLLTRVKYLHGRLDQILGKQGSKAKDVYESKICLASRIVKVERQVDDIESKLDQLIDLYMEDRKRLLALPSAVSSVPLAPPSSAPPPGSPDSNSSGPTTSYAPASGTPLTAPSSSLAVPGAPPPYTSVLKPKPILVDKQASEPNTPTSKHFERPMTRGYSDVSQRMKKRVTLSSLPSRHSLEVKEPDLLQVPQVVQIEHLAAPYIDDDCDSTYQDDECCTMVTECDSLMISEEDHTIQEEPATISEENEVSNFVIPTISASVAQEATSLQVPPPSILSHTSDVNHHNSSQHHHSKYHYPRHSLFGHHHSYPPPSSYSSAPSSSSYTLLPVLEPPVLVTESIELHATEGSACLPPEIITTIAMEESSSS